VLFNSFEFLLFLPIVFILYWLVFNKSLRWQNILVLVASYYFYGWWSYKFMGLLALSTFLDYVYGFFVASPNRRKAKSFLWLSIVNNLGILGVFKYYNFFATQYQTGLELLGLKANPVLLNVALPVGISFYTFHGMSYVFDIYRGKQKPVSNFVDYAVFVAFFPLLVAGPIERASHLLPQVQLPRVFNYTQAVEGCKLILWGMFKKVVIADSLASFVDHAFANHTGLNGTSLVVGAIAFSFQIYGDFSGYSDIALGTAKLFGFELLSNFRFPYFARDIAEFWRRWHISLSTWFRDYLYVPLGGSKQGKLKAVRNTFIIFIVSGFWHGASWNFIVWGFIHACGFLPLLLLNRNRIHVADVVVSFPKNRSM
jgi:D-alanyl-lipoteichoic acid acyltransferase DltB (MBOAT superfamily)